MLCQDVSVTWVLSILGSVKAVKPKIPYFETMHVAVPSVGDTDNTRASAVRTQFDARARDEVETGQGVWWCRR